MKMKKLLLAAIAATMVLGFCACRRNTDKDYALEGTTQRYTAQVTWNPEDYDFEEGNAYYLQHFAEMLNKDGKAGGCSSWRNGDFHGRNLDWYQANYGCLIIKMPRGGKVKHASVALLNSSSTVTQYFIEEGKISGIYKKVLPCAVVDGINDAGVAVNINIVPHAPGSKFNETGDLSSQCVVRYVLDNAGSVEEAITLLGARTICQSIVKLAGDQTHYMISDSEQTAVVEFDQGQMVVTYFKKTDKGFYSDNNTPAIMTNLYDFAIERWGLGTDEFFNHHPFAMGVERWNTIQSQYDNAANGVKANFDIAQSVWYFKNFMADKTAWYSENALATGYGKDSIGWYYMENNARVACEDYQEAQLGFWNSFMESYWSNYAEVYGTKADPHVKGNDYWETSHTVVYDLAAKKGYVVPFENFYAPNKGELDIITLELPE